MSGGRARAAAKGVKGEGDHVDSAVGDSGRARGEGLGVAKERLEVARGELGVAAKRCQAAEQGVRTAIDSGDLKEAR